jgi:hypothetical protein
MITPAELVRTAIVTGVTALVGLFLFLGSIHGGGAPFFAGMVVMPPLFLLYKGWLSLDSFALSLAVVLALHYVLWLLLVVAYSRIRGHR